MEALWVVLGIFAVMWLVSAMVRSNDLPRPESEGRAGEWLKSKAQNSRAYMFSKELKWKLEQEHELERAMILAMVALMRLEFAGTADAEIFVHPEVLEREDAVRLMNMLQDTRDQTAQAFKQLEVNLQRLGSELPEFSKKHGERVGRSLEVLLVTIATSIRPASIEDARLCWQLLSAARPRVPEAIDRLFEVERRTAEVTGNPDTGMFGSVDRDSWIAATGIVPAFAGE